MHRHSLTLAALVALVLTGPAVAATDSGTFVVRLGQDTVGVERYSRTGNHLEVDQVGRAPRVLRRHFVYDLRKDELVTFSMVVTPPDNPTPTQTIDARFDGDSLRVKIQAGTAPATNSALAMPRSALIYPNSAPWSRYDGEIAKFVKSGADSAHGTMFLMGAAHTDWLRLHRLGKDSVEVSNGHEDVFRARVDKAGHILGVLPVSGTGKFSVDRVNGFDLEAMAASFAAREQAAGRMGALSPRDTISMGNVGGANLWLDYSRPSKRGRVVFGGVVPYGEVWRTGANAATQFKTDKALDFGGTVVPAGFYTLWTIPSADGWKLVINSETGQWGTEHKSEKDLYTIPMKVSALPAVAEKFTISLDTAANGGTLNLDWDTTRASASFTVAP